jgi:hypothetical protein
VDGVASSHSMENGSHDAAPPLEESPGPIQYNSCFGLVFLDQYLR